MTWNKDGFTMNPIDWAKIYAKMDKRIVLKYEQLPCGEQIGKQPQTRKLQQNSSPDVIGELI